MVVFPYANIAMAMSLRFMKQADNIASRRVAEKIGAVLARIKPEDDGSYCAVFELKPEYLQYR
jgi:hypothetical protein